MIFILDLLLWKWFSLFALFAFGVPNLFEYQKSLLLQCPLLWLINLKALNFFGSACIEGKMLMLLQTAVFKLNNLPYSLTKALLLWSIESSTSCQWSAVLQGTEMWELCFWNNRLGKSDIFLQSSGTFCMKNKAQQSLAALKASANKKMTSCILLQRITEVPCLYFPTFKRRETWCLFYCVKEKRTEKRHGHGQMDGWRQRKEMRVRLSMGKWTMRDSNRMKHTDRLSPKSLNGHDMPVTTGCKVVVWLMDSSGGLRM